MFEFLFEVCNSLFLTFFFISPSFLVYSFLLVCQCAHGAHSCFFSVYTLFSASCDKTLKQWDLESNSCIRTFQGRISQFSSLAATVHADRVLSGHFDGSVLLWDIATGQQLASVNAHNGRVSCLAVTPDGSSFVSGSRDRSLKLWRFEAPKQLAIEFSGHTLEVNACVVSSDGSRLYSGSSDKSICVWDMSTGQQLASIQTHTSGVTSLALSGSLLVSGSCDKTVKLWDAGSVQLLHTLHGHPDYVLSVAVSSDGSQRVLSCGGNLCGSQDYSVHVWDALLELRWLHCGDTQIQFGVPQ